MKALHIASPSLKDCLLHIHPLEFGWSVIALFEITGPAEACLAIMASRTAWLFLNWQHYSCTICTCVYSRLAPAVIKLENYQLLVAQKVFAALQKEEETASFESIPQLADLGRPFQSTKAERLTEEETEYNVVLVKHVFESHVLLQFTCTNTVAEQVLEKVSVSLDLEDAVRLPQLSALLSDARRLFGLPCVELGLFC